MFNLLLGLVEIESLRVRDCVMATLVCDNVVSILKGFYLAYVSFKTQHFGEFGGNSGTLWHAKACVPRSML